MRTGSEKKKSSKRVVASLWFVLIFLAAFFYSGLQQSRDAAEQKRLFDQIRLSGNGGADEETVFSFRGAQELSLYLEDRISRIRSARTLQLWERGRQGLRLKGAVILALLFDAVLSGRIRTRTRSDMPFAGENLSFYTIISYIHHQDGPREKAQGKERPGGRKPLRIMDRRRDRSW